MRGFLFNQGVLRSATPLFTAYMPIFFAFLHIIHFIDAIKS